MAEHSKEHLAHVARLRELAVRQAPVLVCFDCWAEFWQSSARSRWRRYRVHRLLAHGSLST